MHFAFYYVLQQMHSDACTELHCDLFYIVPATHAGIDKAPQHTDVNGVSAAVR